MDGRGIHFESAGLSAAGISVIGDIESFFQIFVVPVSQLHAVLERRVEVFVADNDMGDAQLPQFKSHAIGERAIPYPFEEPTAFVEGAFGVFVLLTGSGYVVSVFIEAAVAGIEEYAEIFHEMNFGIKIIGYAQFER